MVTIESVTAELEDARRLAVTHPRGASAAVSAVMGKAKLHGLLREKHEHGLSDPLKQLASELFGTGSFRPKEADDEAEPKANAGLETEVFVNRRRS